jgi:hypothetical protein
MKGPCTPRLLAKPDAKPLPVRRNSLLRYRSRSGSTPADNVSRKILDFGVISVRQGMKPVRRFTEVHR